MTSLARYYSSNLIGFFSYSREDDTDFSEILSRFRIAIQAELGAQLGRNRDNFHVWQDRFAIPHGALWRNQITESINQASFFVPIITPRVINSHHCAFEFEAFLTREKELRRDDLVFPILYIPVPELDDESLQTNPVVKLVKDRQYLDWRNFRYRPLESPEAGEAIGQFCENIANALRKPWLSPEELKQQDEEAARQKAEEDRRKKEEKLATQKAQKEQKRQLAAEAARIAAEKELQEKEREKAEQLALSQRQEQEALAARRLAEETALAAARSVNSVAAFDEFLEHHKDSELAAEAQSLKDALVCRQELYRGALTSDDFTVLKSFCRTYQNGPDVDEVRTRLRILKPAWYANLPVQRLAAASVAILVLAGGAVFYLESPSSSPNTRNANLDTVKLPLTQTTQAQPASKPVSQTAQTAQQQTLKPAQKEAPAVQQQTAKPAPQVAPVLAVATAQITPPPASPPATTPAAVPLLPATAAAASSPPASPPTTTPAAVPLLPATAAAASSPPAAPFRPGATAAAAPSPPAQKLPVCQPTNDVKAEAEGGTFLPISVKLTTTPKALRSIAIAPDGKTFATAGEDGIVRFWEAATLKLLHQLGRQPGQVYTVSYSDSGKLLATASDDGIVRIWDTETFTQRQVLSTGDSGVVVPLYGASFEPGSNPRYIDAAGKDGNIWIWKLTSPGTPVKKASGESEVRALSFAPKGTGEFASASFDGKIRFFTAPNRTDVVQASSGKLLHVAYSPDAKLIASTGSDAKFNPATGVTAGNKALKIWSATANHPLVRAYDLKYAVSVAWSADGKRLVTGGYKDVRVWDAQSNAQLQYFGGHIDDVEAVAFHPNQKWLLSAGEDGTAKLWDIAGGRLLLSTAAYENGDYVSYTPMGCYSGSALAGNYLRFTTQEDGVERDVSALAKDALSLSTDASASLLPK